MPSEAKNNMDGHNSIRYVIAQTQQELLDAMVIRAICFIEEEGVAARLALDGNDFNSTHALIYKGDEPIGALRIRWFAKFAKIERTAIRANYRNPRLLKKFSEYIFAHIARKGYDTVVTQAKPVYANLWVRTMKFEEVTSKAPALYSGDTEPYIELVRRLEVPADAIGLETEAAILSRVEGAWDTKSSYEATS